MKEVLHVPGMTSNLVAVSGLEDEGNDVLCPEGEFTFRSMVVTRGLRLVFVMEACTD